MLKKLQHDNRGIASALYIILAVVVVAAIGFVGWRIADNKNKPLANSTNTSSTSSTQSTNTSVSSTCLALYHDNNLCRFSDASTDFTKTAYTANITESENGTNSTMTLESDGKGNTSLKGSSDGQVIDAITLNGNTYIQSNGSGPWIEYSTGQTAPTTNPTSNMNIGVGSSGITFKSDGTAACGSLTCLKYQVTDSAMPKATQYVLFDNSNYKLREWQYSDGSGNSTDMTVTYTSVNITAPTPVESFSSLSQ